MSNGYDTGPLPLDPDERSHAIDQQLAAGRRRMEALERGQHEMRKELRENTRITQEIADVMTAGRVGLKVLGGIGTVVKWLGVLAAGALAIWTFLYAATHGGATPK